jgi:uncharacterized protein YbjT (DUF2867 family)
MKKILLAGPTGNLGPHLAKEMIAEGMEVFALVRPQTIENTGKVGPLKAMGVHLVPGDLNDPASLDSACQGMDAVVSALGGGQLMQQTDLLNAAVKAGVKRFIPSEFGVDPYASGPGVCDLFDAKATIQQKVKESGIDYTMIYTNCFLEFWGSGLGQIANNPSSGEVMVYGDGNVPASMVALPDIARFTTAMITDPSMANKEVRITANVMTQEELISLWEKLTGSTIRRNHVPEKALLETIEASTSPETMMNRIFTQLFRSVWIKGDTMKPRPETVEATECYPDIPIETTETFFSKMLVGA